MNSTVAERERLLKIARAAKLARSGPRRPPIEPVDRGGRLPLSFAQQRLWFLEQLEEVGSTYHIPGRRRLVGNLDRPALRRALDAIVARHESLRTTFVEVDGQPEQRIAPAGAGFALVEHDLADAPDRDGALRRVVKAETESPFDLRRGPLIRGRLVRMAPDDHVLLLTMHHIVSDGWSLGVLMNELATLYGAFRDGRPDPLAPLPVQYADYAAWQRRWVRGEVLDRQASYWREALAGAPELLELPTDRPRPARVDHAGASIALELDPALTASLKALSERHGTTLFMTALAGWATVLSRLSGQRDVVVGVPTANRGQPEIQELIGFFVNTLALRLDLGRSPSVAELLAQVKARTLGAQQHQDLPFEQIVQMVRPVRSLAHQPLFQVMFAWQSASGGGALSLPGLAVGAVAASDPTSKFDLSLVLFEANGRVTGRLTYATALFDPATAERYGACLVRVLEQMAADDTRPVDRLALLPPRERRRMVDAWNRTDADYPADACVHELFQAQARRTPHATALIADGQAPLTYAELNAQANRLAHHLRARGVGPDVPVGLCLERGPEMIVAVLAVLKAGGAYVPLDPEYPADRLAYMLADSAPAVLLTQSSLAALFADVAVPRIRVDADEAEWADAPSTDPARGALTPDHLAYIIYTSGSTGRPKGVMNQHRALVNRLAWGQRAWGIDADEAVLCKTSLNFDGSVREILLPLMAGGRVVIARPGGHRDPAYLLEVIGREGITTVNLVPSLLQVLLDAPEVENLRGLRRVLCGGEALPGALLERFRAALGEVQLHNLYGPSEAATAVTAPRCQAEPGRAGVPIGGPVANTRVYVLDGAGEPVPVGVAGELYIGGVPVARGYLGRAALTAERFVPDALGAPGARLYRTGDVVRWLAGGRLDFVGRNDAQVKVRGFRVEPGEIEARLREHAAVREAVVVVREDVPGDRRLVAYCVADAAVEVDSLRAHAAERLPEYMVPAAYVRLDALPLGPSGKLDGRALPAPEGDAYARRGYEAPVGETEQALAEIWAEVLRIERVGRWDDFFELGGHSLLAVQVVSRLRQALGAEIALREVFAAPVLADLARAIDAATRATLPAIEPADRTGPLPLSFAQQRLWFLEQLGGTGAAYHIPMRLRLRGPLDRDALRRALDRIVARHEALRTAFAQQGGQTVQRVAPIHESAFLLVEHDLHAVPDAEDALRRWMADEASAPFGLEQGPLIRGRLIQMAPDDHVLLVTLHHIVSDGWSMGVFTRELSALYGAFLRGQPDPLPALPVQYTDYAAWQRRWVEGEVLREQAEYWKRTLSGAPELLELPADRPRPARQDFAGAAVPVELDPALTTALKALSRRHGTTLYMTLLAGWATVLGRLSGQDEVVVGSPSANRGRREIEGLIGFFLNTLALRVNLSAAPTVAALLGQVRARALEAQQHQDIPFEQVVEQVRPVRSLAYSPLFQVLLTWQNAPGASGLELPGLQVGGVDGAPAHATAKFDLSLSLWERDGRIRGAALYATALFERETVERWVGYLRRALEEMAEDEHRPVDRLALLPADERARIVDAWNRTDADYPADSCLHEPFEAQAARTPNATAVVSAAETLTYGELNARANRLAHHLRGLGMGPGVRVGLCVERGPAMVVGVLGVLKAGGVFVPLDPAYPRERLQYMLADSAPAAVLAQGSVIGRLADVFAARADVPVLEVDAANPAWANQPATDPERGGLTPAHPAYVTYTSGSTGQPKGVPSVHHKVLNLVHWYGRELGLTERDAVLLVMSFSFDGTYRNLFAPLFAGGQLHLAGEPFDPPAIVAQIAAHGISTVNLTPTAFQSLVEADRDGALGRMRTVVLVGEAVQPRKLMELPEPRPALVNLYGPTECSGIVTYHRFDADLTRYLERPVPVGRPIPNGRIYILDESGGPVPVGVAGELYIGGTPVGNGYQNRPDQTAERFVADPFGGEPGARLYRTGDRARWLADGTIEFLGRTDHQVKIRGVRVELGEIEARLAEHAAVRQAVVLAREDARGETRLVAYHVGEAGPEALRAHLAAILPAHMVPAAYVRLDALPLTTSGKLDRRALPAPDDSAYVRRSPERPRGPTEEALAEIWAEVLGVEQVGRRDHFFDLGGHSLLAVRLVDQVRQALSPDVTLDELFAYPTLEAFAARLDGKAEWLGTDHAVPVRATGAQPPLFIVHDMTGLVAYAQLLRPHLDPDIPLYALPGPLNSTDEVSSMEHLVGRLVRMVGQVQPEGPYRLAGWSAGGIFAYAVAQRLIEMGRTVEFVGMMDTSHPICRLQRVSPRARQFVVLDLLSRDCSAPAPTFEAVRALRDETAGHELPEFIATCHARGLLPRTVTVERAEQVSSRIALLRRSSWEFEPRPLPVPVHFFSASGETRNDPRRGWKELPGGAPIHLEYVPGTHLTMFRKGNVEALAEALSRAIRATSAVGTEAVATGPGQERRAPEPIRKVADLISRY